MPDLPTTPELVSQLAGGPGTKPYWLATSYRLPQSSKQRWKSHRQLFRPDLADQCGVLMKWNLMQMVFNMVMRFGKNGHCHLQVGLQADVQELQKNKSAEYSLEMVW